MKNARNTVLLTISVVLVLAVTFSTAGAQGELPPAEPAEEEGDEIGTLLPYTAVPSGLPDFSAVLSPTIGVDASLPVPTYPIGGAVVSQKIPIYKFTLDPSGIKYEVQVFTKDTHILIESIKGTGSCTTYCQLQSTIALKPVDRSKHGFYTWKVRSRHLTTGWSNWSDEVEFAVISRGFTSYFTTVDKKWSEVYGTWSVTTAGYLKTNGIYESMSSTIEKHLFLNAGLVYEVRMKRKNETYTPNVLYFQGEPGYLAPVNRAWLDGYEFNVTAAHWYLKKRVDGTVYNLTEIAEGNFVTPSTGWKTMTVWHKGNEISIWVNQAYLGTFTDTTYVMGYVGIGMLEGDPNVSPLLVDYAKVYYSAYAPYPMY